MADGGSTLSESLLGNWTQPRNRRSRMSNPSSCWLLESCPVQSLDEDVSCRHKSLIDVPAIYATRWQIADTRAYGITMTVYWLQRGANLMRFNCKSSCPTMQDDGKRESQMSYQIEMRWNVLQKWCGGDFFWRKLRSEKHIPHQASFQKEKMSNQNFL